MLKRYCCVILTLAIFLCSSAFAKMSNQELAEGYEKCMKEKTAECFRLLYSKSQNNIVRYNYAVSLYNEKRYEEARRECSNFIYNDKGHPELVENAKKMISVIDERYKNQVKANSVDKGNYLSEIKEVAKWQHPENIKVYIQPYNGKEILFRRALQTWDNRLMPISFSFITNPDGADIQCSFVDYIGDKIAGITEPKGLLINRSTGEKYFNPPVSIRISLQDPNSGRPFTDNELQSVILHEVGHALGILDHTKNKNDIMYYSTETYKNSQISNRDANTIQELYK